MTGTIQRTRTIAFLPINKISDFHRKILQNGKFSLAMHPVIPGNPRLAENSHEESHADSGPVWIGDGKYEITPYHVRMFSPVEWAIEIKKLQFPDKLAP
jgi:hypothetical protein